MTEYDKLPEVPIKVKRGNTKKWVIQGIKVDGEYIDLTTICPKIQFKSTVDALRYADFELTVANGGMVLEPNRLELNFGRETSRLSLNTYYGDLLVIIDDRDATILRIKLELSGVVTTKKEGDECSN